MSLRKSNWVDNPRSTVTRETNNFYRQILDILSTRYIAMLSGNADVRIFIVLENLCDTDI